MSEQIENLRRLWVACIVHRSDGSLLLAERRGAREIDPGIWGPPGGKARVGETIIDTAVREFREETGAELLEPVVIGFVDCDVRGLVMLVHGDIGDQEMRRREPDKMHEWGWIAKPVRDGRFGYPWSRPTSSDGLPVQEGIRAYWAGKWSRVEKQEKKS